MNVKGGEAAERDQGLNSSISRLGKSHNELPRKTEDDTASQFT
jgi:hypothetical protein